MSSASRRPFAIVSRTLLGCVLLAGAVAAQGTVLVVDDDGGPGVDFTDVPSAVAAASSGDMILVRAGDYTGDFVIDGKGLMLAAETNSVVNLQGSQVDVQNLAANQHVILRGIDTFVGQFNFTNNLGTIWVEDAQLAYGDWDTEATIVANDCANVVIRDCEIYGMSVVTVFAADWAASHAVWGSNSQITVSNSTLFGGPGDGSPYGQDVNGGDGVHLVSGSVFVSSSDLFGGDGSDKMGGAGMELAAGVSSYLKDTTLTAGPGQTPGQPLVAVDPPLQLAGVPPLLTIDSPLRYGNEVVVDVFADPGSVVFLLKQTTPYGLFAPQFGGVLLIDLSISHTVVLGVMPGSGQLTLSAIVPALPFFEGIQLANQVAVVPPTGGVQLGNGTYVLLLDPADVPAGP